MALGFDTKVNSVSIQLTDNVAVWTLLGNGRLFFSPQKHLSHKVLKAFKHNNSIDFKVQWPKCLPVFEEFSLVKDFDIYISHKMYSLLWRNYNSHYYAIRLSNHHPSNIFSSNIYRRLKYINRNRTISFAAILHFRFFTNCFFFFVY